MGMTPTLREQLARAACYVIERPCDGECAAAGRCMGGPASVFGEIADAALMAIRKAPITEGEIEAVARAVWEAWCVGDSAYETTWDDLEDKSKTRDLAHAAIIADRARLGREE